MALGMPLAVVAYQTYQNGQVPPYVIEAIKKGGSSLWQLSGQLSSLGSQWGGDFGSLIGQSFVTPDTPWLVRHSLAPVGGALGTIAGGIGLPYSAYRTAKCGVNSLCTYVWNHL